MNEKPSKPSTALHHIVIYSAISIFVLPFLIFVVYKYFGVGFYHSLGGSDAGLRPIDASAYFQFLAVLAAVSVAWLGSVYAIIIALGQIRIAEKQLEIAHAQDVTDKENQRKEYADYAIAEYDSIIAPVVEFSENYKKFEQFARYLGEKITSSGASDEVTISPRHLAYIYANFSNCYDVTISAFSGPVLKKVSDDYLKRQADEEKTASDDDIDSHNRFVEYLRYCREGALFDLADLADGKEHTSSAVAPVLLRAMIAMVEFAMIFSSVSGLDNKWVLRSHYLNDEEKERVDEKLKTATDRLDPFELAQDCPTLYSYCLDLNIADKTERFRDGFFERFMRRIVEPQTDAQ